MRTFTLLMTVLLTAFAPAAMAGGGGGLTMDLTTTAAGFLAIGVFVVAYTAVIFEEQIHMRKSKPVLLAAGVIWIIIAFVYMGTDKRHYNESIKSHHRHLDSHWHEEHHQLN